MDNVFEMDLGQLFAAADEIGSKYQSEADKAEYDAQMAKVKAEIASLSADALIKRAYATADQTAAQVSALAKEALEKYPLL